MISLRLSDYVNQGRFGKRLGWDSVHGVLRSADYRHTVTLGGMDIKLSLEGFDRVDPDGLLWVLLLADQLKSRDNVLWLELPRSTSQLAYIKASRFYRAAQDLFALVNLYSLEQVEDRSLPPALTFTKVDLNSLGRLFDGLHLFLLRDFTRTLDISPQSSLACEELPVLQQLIVETSKNIVQHSRGMGRDGDGYFVISHSQGQVSFCIGDAGRGFLSSMRSKGANVRDDADAVLQALLYRYYQQDGEGLFKVTKFISQVGGTLRVRSGRAEARLDFSGPALQSDQQTTEFIRRELGKTQIGLEFPGVQIEVQFRKRR